MDINLFIIVLSKLYKLKLLDFNRPGSLEEPFRKSLGKNEIKGLSNLAGALDEPFLERKPRKRILSETDIQLRDREVESSNLSPAIYF